jgi:hypothetical protein
VFVFDGFANELGHIGIESERRSHSNILLLTNSDVKMRTRHLTNHRKDLPPLPRSDLIPVDDVYCDV